MKNFIVNRAFTAKKNINLISKRSAFILSILVVLLTAFNMNVWGQTSTFTDKNLSVGAGEPTWSSSITAGSFESSSYARGVAWPSGGDPVLTSSSVSGTITGVSVVASTNAGSNKASLSVSVGGSVFSPASTYIADGTSNANQTYSFTGSASGTVQITVTNSNSSKTVWIKSITITTSGGGSTYTVTLDKNGSTSEITGCSGTYTLPKTGEHVANACDGWVWHCWANAAYSTSSPTTTAPSSTVINSMTGAGTAYAVYKHTEASGGSSTSTFVSASQGWNNGDAATTKTIDGVTYSFAQNGGSNAPKFYTSSNGVHLYQKNQLTVNAGSSTISSIVFTLSRCDGWSASTGTWNSGTSTWTGSASSVTFTVTNTSGYQVRITSIVVTIGGGSTITYTSSPDCVECLTKVTLTKGEESHGTFTLDQSNGEHNNCTSNFVVHVTGISPSSGYYCSGVTATGDHNTVSGPDGSGNYTVTYEKGYSITSTITAEFTANPTYTVTWYMDGDESNTDSYEEGDAIVFPGSATGCDGKVFRGWSADPVAETDVEPSYVTSATMPAHAVTYYAVYATMTPGTGTAATYEFAITSSDFSGSSYDPNNGEHTSTATDTSNPSNTMTVTWVSYNVSSSSGTQWKKSGSYIYNSTDLGTINSVTISGDALSVYYGTSEEPTETSLGSNDGYFKVANNTSNAKHTTSVTVNFTTSSGTPDTYSEFTTTCGAAISAKNVGWITTAAGQTVKRVINVSAKNFEDDVTLAVTCANSNFSVSLGATAVPAGATGLTTTLTVEYTPTTPKTKDENVEIVLTAGDKTRTITVNGRAVPDDFLLITKKSSAWYALPANMNAGAGQYDGVEVSPNDATTPTAVAVSPSTLVYNLASVASSRYADYGNLVRLVGNKEKCLWGNTASSSPAILKIQNYAKLASTNGENYEWDLKTTDGVHYFVESPCNAEYAEGRRLAYGAQFGMYKEETVFFIVSAGCSSQPGDVQVGPRRVDATFSWVSNSANMHIDLYTNEGMTEGHKTATVTSSPYVFTGLEETTDYWYKLTPDEDTDCAVTGTFKTTGPLIDIVEWQENGVVLFIDKGDITPVVVIDGQEEHGSITGGGDATELFFAKYFEGAGSMKLLSIFNGTKDAISLSNYKFVDRHASDRATTYGADSEYDLSSLGSINAGQEIIFFSRPLSTETELLGCSTDFLNSVATKNKQEDNPRWIECASGKFANKSIIINGNDAVLLKKNGTIIDVIGALNAPGQETNCKSEDAWKGTIKNMDKGKSPSDPAFDAFYEASSKSPSTTADSISLLAGFGINLSDDEIEIPTARCIFFRDKRVTSGDSAVLMNTDDFVTFTNHTEGGQNYKAEWYGRSVCMTTAMKTAAGVSSDAQATCNSYQDIANMDYNKYYIDWSNINPGQDLDEVDFDPETKEYTIPIDNMRQYACLKLRFQLRQGEEVLTEASQQVPIVVAANSDTNDPLFSELVVDKGTGLPSYSHSVERCKECNVVILNNVTLTKGPDSDENDVQEIRNLKIYPGGKLVVPTGTTYKVNSIAFRRQEDIVSSANIKGTGTLEITGGSNNVYFDMRVDPSNWHFFSLPYDCDVSDIRFANEEETAVPVLGTDYLLMWYDGARRAETRNDQSWENVAADATLKKGLGYIYSLPGGGHVRRELRFPMSNEVLVDDKGDATVGELFGYGCDQDDLGPNHKGWNLIGAPYLMPYSTASFNTPLATGELVHTPDPWDGKWMIQEGTEGLRYIVEPIDNGWSGYQQVPIGGYQMQPFTCYFVQIGGTNPETEQGVAFTQGNVIRSIVRRAPKEYSEEVEDNHPVWCAVDITNTLGETDETTLLISNDFTDDYDMMNDLVKMRGSYYSYYTRPVIASRNNDGEMAFNALPDASAEAGVPLNYFAASTGEYTIAYNDKYGREEIKAVMLNDKQTGQWIDLMENSYTFASNRVDNTDRFVLSVRVERKKAPEVLTDFENIGDAKDGPRKLLIYGHVYIQRGARIYDITGKQVKH